MMKMRCILAFSVLFLFFSLSLPASAYDFDGETPSVHSSAVFFSQNMKEGSENARKLRIHIKKVRGGSGTSIGRGFRVGVATSTRNRISSTAAMKSPIPYSIHVGSVLVSSLLLGFIVL